MRHLDHWRDKLDQDFEIESGEFFWISGPRKDRNDRLSGGNSGVVVDADVRVEYAKITGCSESQTPNN